MFNILINLYKINVPDEKTNFEIMNYNEYKNSRNNIIYTNDIKVLSQSDFKHLLNINIIDKYTKDEYKNIECTKNEDYKKLEYIKNEISVYI